MQTATHNIIQEFTDVEFYVYTSPITKSALDLADEIKEKFQVQVSPATINKYRKGMPKTKIKHLHEERVKNIESLRFIVELLKEQMGGIEDPALKLRYIQEIAGCIKEIDALVDSEVKYLRNSAPF